MYSTRTRIARRQRHRVRAPAKLVKPRFSRSLPRPHIKHVLPDNIVAHYPELDGVTPEYIRERLPLRGPQMLAALPRLSTQPPSTALPAELAVVMHDMLAADRPTHMLAVHSPAPSPGPRRKVTLFPVHQLVLAANCANLPRLPPSRSPTALPVVPLCLPSPATYPLLQSFLYTKRADLLLSVLRPPVPANLQTLARQACLIDGVWRNACALGVVDHTLWDSIDLAWGAVVDASLPPSPSH